MSDDLVECVTEVNCDAISDTLRVALEQLQLPDDFSNFNDICLHLAGPCRDNIDLTKRIIAFVTIWFDFRPSDTQENDQNNRTIEDIIKTRWASCADRDFLCETLFHHFNIQSRRVGFQNIPYQGNHSATEVLIDNNWRFFDATTGVYFTDHNKNEILSIQEIRMLYPEVNMHRTASIPASGVGETIINARWQVALMGPVYTNKGEIICLPFETYILSDTVGASVLAHDDFEITLDLNEKSAWSLGRPDTPNSVSQNIITDSGAILPTLLERLGKHGHGNIRHSFNLITNRHRKLQFVVGLRAGQSASEINASVKPMITPEFLSPTFTEARIVSKYAGGGTEVAVFEAHLLPPMTKFRIVAPWNHEYEIKFISIMSFCSTRQF